jgi:hypothetical protein
MNREWIVIGLIVIILGTVTKTVYEGILHQPDVERHVPTWRPPVIPDCDAPLWDRIKDRCNEATQSD